MKSLNGPVQSRLANDEKACTNFTDLYFVYVLHIQKVECLGKKFPEKKTTTEVRKPDWNTDKTLRGNNIVKIHFINPRKAIVFIVDLLKNVIAKHNVRLDLYSSQKVLEFHKKRSKSQNVAVKRLNNFMSHFFVLSGATCLLSMSSPYVAASLPKRRSHSPT